MPEALARAERDVILREDARPTRAPRRSNPAPARAGFFAALRRKPGRALLLGSLALLAGAIGVNALFLQNERHPAPFFRSADKSAAPAPARAAVPLPPQRPAENAPRPVENAQRAASRPNVPPATAASAPAVPAPERVGASPAEQKSAAAPPARPPAREPAPTPPAIPVRHDPIAALLRDGRPSAPTPPAPIPNASAEQTKRIFAVQEALRKLGHNIKPDGIAGPGTRVAIEAFERSQKWQVTGNLSPKMMRELSSLSGVKIP